MFALNPQTATTYNPLKIRMIRNNTQHYNTPSKKSILLLSPLFSHFYLQATSVCAPVFFERGTHFPRDLFQNQKQN